MFTSAAGPSTPVRKDMEKRRTSIPFRHVIHDGDRTEQRGFFDHDVALEIAMTGNVSPFIDDCRTRARAIKARHDRTGTPVSLGQAYELLAQSEGFRTWGAMRAAGEAKEYRSEVAAPEMPTLSADRPSYDPFVTLYVTRRLSNDARDARSHDIDKLLAMAHSDLGYVFFDGEEQPAMRFRAVEKTGEDEYSFLVDVEVSPDFEDDGWIERGMSSAEVLGWSLVEDQTAFEEGEGTLAYSGSGVRVRQLPWTMEEAPSPESFAP